MAAYAFPTVCLFVVLGGLAAQPLATDARVVLTLCTVVAGCGVWSHLRATLARGAVIAAFVAGACAGMWNAVATTPLHEHRTARYAGTAIDARAGDDGSSGFTFAIERGPVVAVAIRGTPPPLGVRLVVRGRLEPFDDARNPGETSERDIEAERGIRGRIAHADLLALEPRAYSSTPAALLARAHAWALTQLRERLREPGAAIVAGELWGERSDVPPDVREEFQETGTIHVLVTAGLHLGVVAALACWLLSRTGMPRVLTCAGAAALVWAFVAWSGAGLPAVRAATMLTAALAARACGRSALSWNALALAAAVIALARPGALAGASFALSFSCVASIFVCSRPIEHALAGWALPQHVREALVLTLATQIGTWPVTAATFLQFGPYAVVANLCVVPFVGATMLLSGAQLALAWCAPLAQGAANLTSWTLEWTLSAVRALAALPCASIPMTPAPVWCIALYDVAVVAGATVWQRGRRAWAAVIVAAGIALILSPPRPPDARLRVTVLDVGQADSIVIQTPRGHAILIDGGGRLERGNAAGADSQAEKVGERTVVPFLLRSGIHRLDAIVLTHPHGDHAGGVPPVLRTLHVGELADGGQSYEGHAYRDAIAQARSAAVPIVHPRAGDLWRLDDGVTLQFVGPSLPFIAGSRNDINENSIAFILRYGKFRMFFTGDAGAAAERRFLAEDVDLHANVLKVGHHGSAYGSTPAFVASVRAADAVISVGRHNLFGHPAPATIAVLQRAGSRIERTDRNGATTIVSDGVTYAISTMLPQ